MAATKPKCFEPIQNDRNTDYVTLDSDSLNPEGFENTIIGLTFMAMVNYKWVDFAFVVEFDKGLSATKGTILFSFTI